MFRGKLMRKVGPTIVILILGLTGCASVLNLPFKKKAYDQRFFDAIDIAMAWCEIDGPTPDWPQHTVSVESTKYSYNEQLERYAPTVEQQTVYTHPENGIIFYPFYEEKGCELHIPGVPAGAVNEQLSAIMAKRDLYTPKPQGLFTLSSPLTVISIDCAETRDRNACRENRRAERRRTEENERRAPYVRSRIFERETDGLNVSVIFAGQETIEDKAILTVRHLMLPTPYPPEHVPPPITTVAALELRISELFGLVEQIRHEPEISTNWPIRGIGEIHPVRTCDKQIRTYWESLYKEDPSTGLHVECNGYSCRATIPNIQLRTSSAENVAINMVTQMGMQNSWPNRIHPLCGGRLNRSPCGKACPSLKWYFKNPSSGRSVTFQQETNGPTRRSLSFSFPYYRVGGR